MVAELPETAVRAAPFLGVAVADRPVEPPDEVGVAAPLAVSAETFWAVSTTQNSAVDDGLPPTLT